MTDLSLLEPFLPDIRMRLHIERIRPGEASTSFMKISDRSQLGALISAYRKAGSKVETRLENPFSKPMTVADVAEQLDAFSAANRAAFLAYLDSLDRADEIPDWQLPVYDLGQDGKFLMDGNHRAVATYMSGKPFELKLLVLHAPVDRRILIPLKYWDRGLLRFSRRVKFGQQRTRRHAS